MNVKKTMIVLGLAACASAFGQGKEDFMRQQAFAEMQRVSGQIDVLQSNLNELVRRVSALENRGDSESMKAEIAALKQFAANGGKVVFGAGLELTSRAGTGDGDQVPTVTAKNVALEIAGGHYQVRGVSAGEGGSISITGGQFWSNFNPSSYVAQGYAVQEIEGNYKYEVVKASESIEEYVVSVTGGDPNEVATWLKEKVSNLEAVKGCEYLKASFELDVDLITDATTVDITDFSMSDGFTFTITLDKDATPVVIKRAAEKIASRIRVTDALGTDFAAVDVERLAVDTESGTVTVAPKDGATSEFLKVLIEKDN